MPQSYTIDHLQLDDDSEVIQLLAQFPEIQPISFGDGEQLVREHETSQEIFIVLRGALVVEQAALTEGAAPAMLACITAETDDIAILGEMAYLGAQPRAASIRSCGRTHTLRLEPRHIDGILEHYPMLTRVICRQFSQRLQDTDKALRNLQERFALDPGQRMVQAGEVLFTRGAPATELFQLLAGSIRLDGPDGSRLITPESLDQGLLEPGPFLAGRPQAATATVDGMAFLAVIRAERKPALVRCFPELALKLLSDGGPP